MTRAVDVAGRELPPNTALGTRNLIINGDMRIAQRGTSATGITSNGYYTVDRWQYVGGTTSDAVVTIEQSTDAPLDAEYSQKITITTADTSLAADQYAYIRQSIEGLNSAHLKFGTTNAKTITISFWVKSSVTGTYCFSLNNHTYTRMYVSEYTINSANTWEKKTITITGDTTGAWLTDNSRGLIVKWSLGTGTDRHNTINNWNSEPKFGSSNQTNLLGTSGATWQISLVQLEVGEEATEFEHRPFVDELKRCQRYLNTSFEYGTAIAASSVNTHNGERHSVGQGCTYWATNSYFPTKMRAGPAVTFYYHDGTTQSVNRAAGWNNGTVFNTGWDAVATDSSRINVEWNMNGQTASGRCYLFFEWKAEAEL